MYERLPADLESHRVRREARPADPVLVQVRQPASNEACGAIFMLNIGNLPVQRVYSLGDLGVRGPVYLYAWAKEQTRDEPVGQINQTLSGHGSALYFFSRAPIGKAPRSLDGRLR